MQMKGKNVTVSNRITTVNEEKNWLNWESFKARSFNDGSAAVCSRIVNDEFTNFLTFILAPREQKTYNLDFGTFWAFRTILNLLI